MSHYFDRDPSEWNIEDFLSICEQKTTRAKIGLYITCLNKIVKEEGPGPKREQAQKLLDKYKKVNPFKNFFLLVIWTRNEWRGDDLQAHCHSSL